MNINYIRSASVVFNMCNGLKHSDSIVTLWLLTYAMAGVGCTAAGGIDESYDNCHGMINPDTNRK